ncbi:hypothetical protein PWG71_00550 [Nocardiopsis sp. N85]|uniref:hypothetical protein n=1 Tax=Nocardiopsis sp. N85 TaxID=3029400 RepID=UPI00237F888F|nr:hypothetical protein [Nocardiopsis sp. N85]MDE3719860.1 hypothetical protein [Nocardiopsis sp. N85]
MNTVEGYHLRPSAAVLTLREEFPGFLICELRGGQGRPCLMAIDTRTTDGGRPEPVVCAGAEELRKALRAMEGGAA